MRKMKVIMMKIISKKPRKILMIWTVYIKGNRLNLKIFQIKLFPEIKRKSRKNKKNSKMKQMIYSQIKSIVL